MAPLNPRAMSVGVYGCYGALHRDVGSNGSVIYTGAPTRTLSYLCMGCLRQALDAGHLTLSVGGSTTVPASPTNGDHTISVDVHTTEEGAIQIDDTEFAWGPD